MTNPTAIETYYAGCRFRSRLEARWAVFFDTLRIPWEYEPQGYEIKSMRDGTTRRYLPDFYLPTLITDLNVTGTYVEVKGSDSLADDTYRDMISSAIDYQATPISKGLLLLGQIPDLTKASLVLHTHLRWREGVQSHYVNFAPNAGHRWELDNRHTWHGGWVSHSSAPDWPDGAGWATRVVYIELPLEHRQQRIDGDLKAAYMAARSARFEHGETPRPATSAATSARAAVVQVQHRQKPTLGEVVRQQEPSSVEDVIKTFGGSELVEDSYPDLWPEGTKELVAELDRLDVPLDATLRDARQMGIHARGHLVLKALKFRRLKAS